MSIWIKRYSFHTYNTTQKLRLDKKLDELEKFIEALQKKVSAYSDKVPLKVRQEDTIKMEKYQQ